MALVRAICFTIGRLAETLLVLFVTAKLCGWSPIADWDWSMVLAPLWMPASVVIAILVAVALPTRRRG